MKLYILDEFWKGALVIMAESKEEATFIATEKYPYKTIDIDDWVEYNAGELVRTEGDC